MCSKKGGKIDKISLSFVRPYRIFTDMELKTRKLDGPLPLFPPPEKSSTSKIVWRISKRANEREG